MFTKKKKKTYIWIYLGDDKDLLYIYIYNFFEYYKIVYLYSFIVKVTKFEATSES